MQIHRSNSIRLFFLLAPRVPLIPHDSYASSNGFLGSRFLLIGGAQKGLVSFEAFCKHVYIAFVCLYGIIYFREKKALMLKNLESRATRNDRSKHSHTGIPNDTAIPRPPIEDGRLLRHYDEESMGEKKHFLPMIFD
jgi:hypothetical protein